VPHGEFALLNFLLVFSSIKFDIGFVDKNYLLTILESMRIKIFPTVKIVTSREITLYASWGHKWELMMSQLLSLC
jgi:hypothetical protein